MMRSFYCAVAIVLVGLPSMSQAQIPGVDKDFITSLSNEMGGATPQQAAGAAGAIFGLAKTRMSPGDFAKVSDAVPGMDGLLKAAPAVAPGVPGAATGLAGLTSSFTKLGLQPDMVSKAIPAVTNYVTKSGGADVGKLFAGALK